MIITLKSLTPNENKAVQIFTERVLRALGEHVLSIKLFGSKVHGTDTPESDIDVAIIIDSENLDYEENVLDIAFDINLEYDLYISPKVIPQAVFLHPVWQHTLFIKNIEKEGVALWRVDSKH